MRARAVGLLLGHALDRMLGDPARWHPVAGFGTLASALERRTYAPDRGHGAAHVGLLVAPVLLGGSAVEHVGRHRPWLRVLTTAAATWVVLGGRSLEREALLVGGFLADDDLTAARRRVTHLVGRDPARLGPRDVARATVESVAENTSDAVVAPLLLGAVAGVPGLLGYRAVNTLDAMIGHRSDRYAAFGWTAARLDDAVNLLPARTTAAIAAVCAQVVGGSPARALRAWRRDAGVHPSPNAGPVEAAFAGALGVRLGGTNVYAGQHEDRGTLGDGPTPDVPDIHRSTRLAHAVGWASAAVAALLAASLPTLPRRQESGLSPRRW